MTILIMIANMNELGEILNEAKSAGHALDRQVIGNNTFYIQRRNNHNIYIVKSEPGALNSGAALLTLTEALNNIDIDTIIFSGIAFGNYYKKGNGQNIGDILVSRQLWNYESGKMSQEYISRGDKISATPWLLDRFTNSALEWKDSEIHFGLIASGEKLSNSEAFVKRLMKKEPEIIGGEMEGTALIAVAQRYMKSWILVKGISDWGVDKRDDSQRDVAKMTLQYVFMTIDKYFI